MRRASLFSLLLIAATAATAQNLTLPLWPHGTPEPAQSTKAESATHSKDPRYPGVDFVGLSDVTVPTLTLYPAPAGHNTGAAAVVFPGGGYQHLAFTKEGTMACEWFNSLGMTCVLVKYRIPWPSHFPETFAPLEDAQQAMRLTRAHAAEWKIDSHRIGVMGFSAGGHLAVVLSQHFDDSHITTTPAAADADTSLSARPDFVFLGYPAYLPSKDDSFHLDPNLTPNDHTPPTFLVQAENDKLYINSALVYFRALKDAQVPAEMHLYPDAGHGFGMHPTGTSAEHWTDLAAAWLHTLKILQ
jgi:acetyl esterase/lipase